MFSEIMKYLLSLFLFVIGVYYAMLGEIFQAAVLLGLGSILIRIEDKQ